MNEVQRMRQLEANVQWLLGEVNRLKQLNASSQRAGVSLADPSAAAGLAAIPGTALTAMRSDAAPAIDQSIDPTWTGTHRYSNDIYPAGDARGLMARFVNRLSPVPTDHFRSGSIPAGYSWRAAPFDGVPSTLAYNYYSDYLGAYANTSGGRVFLAKAITNTAAAWQSMEFRARFRASLASVCGIRIDDGGDSNYAEVLMVGLGNGMQRLDFRYSVGGTVNTTNSSIIIPASEFVTVRLLCYYATTYTLYGQLVGEEGSVLNVGSSFHTPVITWCPAAGRVGVIIKEINGGYGVVDWFYSNFG